MGVENEQLLELLLKKIIYLNYSERYMVEMVGCWKQRCTLGSGMQFLKLNCCVYLQVKIMDVS